MEYKHHKQNTDWCFIFDTYVLHIWPYSCDKEALRWPVDISNITSIEYVVTIIY